MKAHNVNYVKESYLESLYFTQDETTDVPPKHRLSFLKLKGSIQKQIQQSFATHRKFLKERSSKFERNMIPQPAYEAPDTTQVCYASPIQYQYP